MNKKLSLFVIFVPTVRFCVELLAISAIVTDGAWIVRVAVLVATVSPAAFLTVATTVAEDAEQLLVTEATPAEVMLTPETADCSE